MKYQSPNESIPQHERSMVNRKIIHLINSGKMNVWNITKQDVYSAYTGNGGIHGLQRKDYADYYQYSQAKKEMEGGQFFTPPWLCQFVIQCLSPQLGESMADLTCGMGGFFNFWPAEHQVYGCEVDVAAYKVAKLLYPDANLVNQDIRLYEPEERFDFIIGNPPYNLKWNVDGKEYLSQLYYCLKAAELLQPMGVMALIVPESFLADTFMNGSMLEEVERHFGFLGQYRLPGNSFAHLGVSDFPIKLQFWQRKSDLAELPGYITEICDIPCCDAETAQEIHAEALAKPLEQKRLLKAKINLELARGRVASKDFWYQVDLMMYHIKTHPRTRSQYANCKSYVERFITQEKPNDMEYEEWQRIRITEQKVLYYLKRVLRKQNAVERDEIRFIKTRYNFRYKAYSQKSKLAMSSEQKEPIPINDAVLSNTICRGMGYDRLLNKKREAYLKQSIPFDKMNEDAGIGEWLDRFVIFDSAQRRFIFLNHLQKQDVNCLLQKPYGGILQWEQGSGKTLAALAIGKYKMEKGNLRNVWVVTTAIAINNNWEPVLQSYGASYTRIKKIADIDKIEHGMFVLTTFEMLCKYKAQIAKKVKQSAKKVVLILDESDEICNVASKRTKSALACFRRVKYVLPMTGTTTRNNIAEIFPQLEVLYNNSVNMLSEAPLLYARNKEDGSMTGTENPHYGLPYPAYKRGYKLFSKSHLPEKITVFGVSSMNQDIYNADVLKKLLDKTVITRTFEEVTGKTRPQVQQILVQFSPEERKVYDLAIKEFNRLCEFYFQSTGNSRKDAMMRLIRQINLLLRICAAPNTMREYTSNELPTKIKKVIDMLREWKGERVAIGVRHEAALEAYANAICDAMPDRPLFAVSGKRASLDKRKRMVPELKNHPDAILLCTQQSLASSINIDFVDKVILPELHYNDARMSQFYFRFIRYTSETEKKKVFYVTYAGSIESNQLQMVLSKEKLNAFMKRQDLNFDDVYKKFGLEVNLLAMLMTKEYDDEGHMQLRWGQQMIA